MNGRKKGVTMELGRSNNKNHLKCGDFCCLFLLPEFLILSIVVMLTLILM